MLALQRLKDSLTQEQRDALTSAYQRRHQSQTTTLAELARAYNGNFIDDQQHQQPPKKKPKMK